MRICSENKVGKEQSAQVPQIECEKSFDRERAECSYPEYRSLRGFVLTQANLSRHRSRILLFPKSRSDWPPIPLSSKVSIELKVDIPGPWSTEVPDTKSHIYTALFKGKSVYRKSRLK